MEPENLLPYMEMVRFHSSKGGLRAAGLSTPTQTLFSLKPLGIATPPPVELWNQVSIYAPPHLQYGDVACKGLGIKAPSIFFRSPVVCH